jgi:hypothetical protein
MGEVGAALLLAGIVLAVNLIFMPREFWRSDARMWRCEAESVLYYHRLWVDPRIATKMGEPGQYFALNGADGHYYSKYGVANTVMAMPPIIVERLVMGRMSSPWQPNLLIFTFWNYFLSVLLALAIYWVSGRYCAHRGVRVAYVLACLFATYVWFYQRAQGSAEIYQALLFTLVYECALRSFDKNRTHGAGWLLAAWALTAMLVLTRVLFVILLPEIAIVCAAAAIARRQGVRAALALAIVPPILIVGLLAWINDVKFGGAFLTGYHQWHPEQHLPVGSELDGLVGMLFSSHWSVFVYFPVLFFALPGVGRFAREHPWDAALVYSMFLVTLLVVGRIPWWRGEWTYGPRYMLFILPMAALPSLAFGEALVARFPARAAWLSLAGVAGVLGVSLWLQFQVISSPFFFVYEVQALLDKHMDRDVAEYLFERPEGLIYRELSSGRDDLDHTRLFQLIEEQSLLTPVQLEEFRGRLRDLLAKPNLYWWQGQTEH